MHIETNNRSVAEALFLGAAALEKAGIDNPRFDAMQLLMFALSARREDIIREPDRCLDTRASLIYDKTIQLRSERRPLAYITGERWFYGRSFKINRAVLIPRPETELLVDIALEKLDNQGNSQIIADIGTGSGCIAVTIVAEAPWATLIAIDISPQALLLARKNVMRHRVEDRVTLVEGDLLGPVSGDKLDMVVSNPPYIAQPDIADLMPEVADYEPAMALWEGAGADGTAVHRRLIEDSRAVLKTGGWLIIEVGAGQADSVCAYADKCGYMPVIRRPDLGGTDRVIAAQWNS